MTNNIDLEIIYEGGVHNCDEGALRLFLKNHGGSIYLAPNGLHFYYFPPDANDETVTENLGRMIVYGEEEGNRWETMTLGQLKANGCPDMTNYVVSQFRIGKWELEKGKSFSELLGELGLNKKEK